LPPRADWDTYLAVHGSKDRAGRAIEAVRRMERAGASVLVVAADVTDPAELRRVREQVVAEFGGLDGILHAAGLPGGGVAELKARDVATKVLAPKLAGTLALRQAFGDLALDFVVLCSSTVAFAGGFGMVDYCAANAFLDAYARSDHGWPCRVLSVNWGGWLEVGMEVEGLDGAAARDAARAAGWVLAAADVSDVDNRVPRPAPAGVEAVARGDERGIRPALGAEAFRRALAADVGAQVVINTEVLTDMLARVRRAHLDQIADTAPVDDSEPAEPVSDLVSMLCAIWAGTIGVDRVRVDDDFFELGGNSLVAVQLIARVSKEAGVRLPMRTLFETPTVGGLAARIERLRADEPAATPTRGITRLARKQ
jgi:acyl carrier protein